MRGGRRAGSKKSLNTNLQAAKQAKQDDFYTQLSDIENELKYYKAHFKGKTVYCNCDDPRVSNFFRYFSYQFEALGLKRLVATGYKNEERDLFSRGQSERAIYLEYEGDKNGNRVPDAEEIGVKRLQGDGDFRSAECIALEKTVGFDSNKVKIPNVCKAFDIPCINLFKMLREKEINLSNYGN